MGQGSEGRGMGDGLGWSLLLGKARVMLVVRVGLDVRVMVNVSTRNRVRGWEVNTAYPQP